MRTLFLIFTIIFVVSGSVDAKPRAQEDCSPVDLNADPQSPLRKMPIYDQDGAGLCYAYAATQLYNYEQIKLGRAGGQVAPRSAAVSGTIHYGKGRENIDGGNPFSVLSAMRSAGYCSREDTEKILSKITKGPPPLTESELSALIINYSELVADPEHPDSRLPQLARRVSCKDQKNFSAIKNLILDKSSQKEIFQSLFKDCIPTQSGYFEIHSYNGELGESRYKNEIVSALSLGRPASIGYCSKRQFQTTSKDQPEPGTDTPCGSHESLITAQRKSPSNECQLLIRNTWGQWRGPEGTECACIADSGEYQSVCRDYATALEIIGCWFERENLMKNTFGVIHIESQ
jgi:hypothetical protein